MDGSAMRVVSRYPGQFLPANLLNARFWVPGPYLLSSTMPVPYLQEVTTGKRYRLIEYEQPWYPHLPEYQTSFDIDGESFVLDVNLTSGTIHAERSQETVALSPAQAPFVPHPAAAPAPAPAGPTYPSPPPAHLPLPPAIAPPPQQAAATASTAPTANQPPLPAVPVVLQGDKFSAQVLDAARTNPPHPAPHGFVAPDGGDWTAAEILLLVYEEKHGPFRVGSRENGFPIGQWCCYRLRQWGSRRAQKAVDTRRSRLAKRGWLDVLSGQADLFVRGLYPHHIAMMTAKRNVSLNNQAPAGQTDDIWE